MPRMRVRGTLYGPASLIGLATALATAALDQASKLWLLQVYRLGERGRVEIAPVLDLHLTWNPGISYGLLQQSGIGRWVLLAISVAAVALLWVWLARARSQVSAIALGLIIGGAVGNAIDRIAYGAVADFVLFHIGTAASRIDWYVFNLADCAIVAGVVGLLYESLLAGRAAKAP
jgi:signal peptidase II